MLFSLEQVYISEEFVHHGIDTMKTCGHLVKVIRKYPERQILLNIDESGLGAGVVDILKSEKIKINAIDVAKSATDIKKFANIRAEMYWSMREWIKEEGCIIEDRALIGDLTSTRYTYTGKGQVLLEKKESVKKRLTGRSPDSADALALALYNPQPNWYSISFL